MQETFQPWDSVGGGEGRDTHPLQSMSAGVCLFWFACYTYLHPQGILHAQVPNQNKDFLRLIIGLFRSPWHASWPRLLPFSGAHGCFISLQQDVGGESQLSSLRPIASLFRNAGQAPCPGLLPLSFLRETDRQTQTQTGAGVCSIIPHNVKGGGGENPQDFVFGFRIQSLGIPSFH